jgi:hypothetical protein
MAPLVWCVVPALQVQLDPAQYSGEAGQFVWERSLHSGPHKDQLEVRRIGNKPCNAQVCGQCQSLSLLVASGATSCFPGLH